MTTVAKTATPVQMADALAERICHLVRENAKLARRLGNERWRRREIERLVRWRAPMPREAYTVEYGNHRLRAANAGEAAVMVATLAVMGAQVCEAGCGPSIRVFDRRGRLVHTTPVDTDFESLRSVARKALRRVARMPTDPPARLRSGADQRTPAQIA